MIIVFICFVFSCFKRDNEISYYRLNEVDKQMIPYKLGQSVNFIDSFGQPLVFTVTKDTIDIYGDEDDDYSLVRTEHLICVLESDSINFGVKMVITGQDSKGERNKNKFNSIYVSVENLLISSLYSMFTFYVYYDNKGNFYIRDFYDIDEIYEVYEINGRIYYDVVKKIKTHVARDENGNSLGYEVTSSLLYNKTYGILQIMSDNKVFLSIDN